MNNAVHSLIQLEVNERTAPQCSVAHSEGDHAEPVTIVQFLKRNVPVCTVSWACLEQFVVFGVFSFSLLLFSAQVSIPTGLTLLLLLLLFVVVVAVVCCCCCLLLLLFVVVLATVCCCCCCCL